MLTINFWLIQLIGAVALVFITLAWNAKTRKKILNLQSFGVGIFVVHYLLLGAVTGAVMSGVTLLRNLIFVQKGNKKWASSKVWLPLFIILSVITLLIFWQGWPSILPALGVIIGTYGISRESPKEIRFSMLLASLLWIPYTIIVHSYSGLVTQLISTVGLLVGMFRLDRKKIPLA